MGCSSLPTGLAVSANNWSFGKVSPQATAEFDLPKPEIMIQDAMKRLRRIIDTYGVVREICSSGRFRP